MHWLKSILLKLDLFDWVRDILGQLRACSDRNCFLAHIPYAKRRLFVETHDPVRYGSISLALERLREEGIEGAMAEVGVWRGHTSKLIRALEPTKKFYLFDTFKGFSPKDLPQGSGDCRFSDTSVEIVKKNVGSLKGVTIIPGYFPESAKSLEKERFSFVMLDVDLFAPTLAGLEYFYPRMSSGGYIFIHDYNSPESNWAVSKATNEFMRDKEEKLIEIPDVGGSVVIRKC